MSDVRFNALRGLAALAWAVLLFGLAGCDRGRPPDLVELSSLTPLRVSAGDRLEIAGSGFPEGKNASVVFHGALYRPLAEPIEAHEIVARGRSIADDRLEVIVDEALEQAFTNEGLRAEHTTFKGTIRVRFDSSSAGSPPVTGTLLGASVDVMPSGLSPEGAAARREAGHAVVQALGLEVAPGADETWVVDSLDEGGRADRAGVQPGDRLLALEGVSILGAGDFRPRPGLEVATLRVEREGYSEPIPLQVDLSGLSPPALGELAPAAGILVGLGVLFVLLGGSLSVVFGLTERRALSRRREKCGPRRPRRLRDLVEDALEPAPGDPRSAPYVTFVVVAALYGMAAIDAVAMPAGVGLAAALGVPLVALLVCRLVDRGRRSAAPGWSLRRGLAGATTALAAIVTSLLAAAALIFASGSVALADLVSAQGGWPWQWHALTNPGVAALALVLLSTVVPDSRRTGAVLAEADLPLPGGTAHPLVRYSEWAHLWAVSGLIAAGCAGGWRIPGVSDVLFAAQPWLQVAGVLLFYLKVLFLAFVAVAMRWVASGICADLVVGFTWRRLVPRAFGAAAVAVLWASAMSGTPLDPEPVVGCVTGGVLLAIGAVWASRLRAALAFSGSEDAVNPWL